MLEKLNKNILLLKSFLTISKNNSYRVAENIINNENFYNDVDILLKNLRNNYSICKKCFFFKYQNECLFCEDEEINQNKICVVEEIKDVFAIQNNLKDNFTFHVLGGAIDLKKKINLEKLNFLPLIERIEKNKNIDEIILATSLTLNGELTANYIIDYIKKYKIKCTKLAKGVPMGSSLEYLDDITLKNAFKNRG